MQKMSYVIWWEVKIPYNLISCSGWEATGSGWVGSAPCIKAKIGIVLLFFVICLIRKWGAEEIGIGFSLLFGLIGGLVPYFLIITIFGSFKAALVIGLVGGLAGGYLGGMFFGGEE